MQETARLAVQDSERRLRDTLESIDAAFLMLDGDFAVIDLNRRAAQMDGRPAARIVARSVFDLWPDVRGTEIEATLRRAMQQRRPCELMHRHVGRSGERWVDLRVFPAARGLTLFFRDVSEQERARQRLAQAETSARLAIRAARLGTWSFVPQTGRLTWDECHRALFGVGAEALIGLHTLLDGIHPDDRARIEAGIAAAMDPAGGGEIAAEYRSIDATDGRERWLAAMGQAQFERDTCTRVDGVVQDITERRRAAAALAESEQRFRAIAEAAPGIVFVTDAAGLNTYVNPQFSQFAGCPAAALLGRGWVEVVHPADRLRAYEQWQDAVASGGAYQVEQRFRRHDGAYRWFLCRGMPMREAPSPEHPDGRIVLWFGTATDIQDLVEARQVLARDRDALEYLVGERTVALTATLGRLGDEEARLRAVFQHSSECLFLLRVDPARGPVFVDVNPPAESVLGCLRADAIGRTPRELSGNDPGADEIEANLLAALRPGAGPHAYLAHRRYGGRERLLEAVAVALDGPDDERLILVTARDVTDQRVLEEALRQSQKMEALGQLTGGVAHDFNNLLTGISGSLELIRTRAAQGRASEIDRYAEAALDSVRRGAALTHRLLAFARRQTLEPRAVDLNRLVAGMDELIRRTVGPGIAIETELAADLWPVLCDANQMENALLNLSLNARDAMPHGGVLRIATANAAGVDKQGDTVSITVGDTGAGMPPEIVERAFEPFFTTKPIGQGTGLGLAMLYGFVRQSGGQASLCSEVGRGTSLRIELPRSDLPAAPPTAPTAPEAPVAAHCQTILLVEDEQLVRALSAEALGGLGYRVLQAADGAMALTLLQDDAAIDLLLTDIAMPGMNGRQLAAAARQLRPGLKVLFVTGYAHDASGEGGLAGPGMALLGKPFGLAALARKVEAILAG